MKWCNYCKREIDERCDLCNYKKEATEVKKMKLDATREEFENLPIKKPELPFNSFVIIPTGKIHDSGYGCMKFALANHDIVVGCVGGCSDVINLNGIGGYGHNYKDAVKTRMVPVIDWNIDLLPNGLLRVFTSNNLDIPEMILSNFEVYDAKKLNSR